MRTLTPSCAHSLRPSLHCGKKITPLSTMMPVFSVNLSWQHAHDPHSNQIFPSNPHSLRSPCFIGCFQSETEPRHQKSTGWLGCSQRKQPWSWQLCVQTQYAPLVCCLISFILCLSLLPAHSGLKQLSLFFSVSERCSHWQDTISGFKIGLPFFTAQKVNSSEMAQSSSSFNWRD